MSENITNLREAESKVVIRGILSEKDLKVVTNEGKKAISGTLTIQTDPDNFIKVSTYAREKRMMGLTIRFIRVFRL